MYDTKKPYKKELIECTKKTWNTPYVEIKPGIYNIIIKKFDYPEVDHTDGIGTKGFYHWQERSFANAVIDALAMNLNDLALVRAVPYKLQNHIILPKDDKEAILETIKALSNECVKRKIAITGGETSIHNNMQGMDISMTVSGFVKEEKPNQLEIGDALVGFKSSGLHSNGFSLVRNLFGRDKSPELIEPTKIYLETILELNKKYDIRGMMHITGGAYSKLKDIICEADVRIRKYHELMPQKIFFDIYNKGQIRGVSCAQMYTTFNCGVGFIIGVSPSDAKQIVSENKDTAIIGEVVKGNGNVIIESAFSEGQIIL